VRKRETNIADNLQLKVKFWEKVKEKGERGKELNVLKYFKSGCV
jgi:hypothetical protein